MQAVGERVEAGSLRLQGFGTLTSDSSGRGDLVLLAANMYVPKIPVSRVDVQPQGVFARSLCHCAAGRV